ncbi:NFATC2-interacting protein-like [Ptychodera flava]|uniref:NFATC2-interacting protein-like n=1 Tax=Ptychodera flava TaxID=63121 RepID=UPI00396A5B3F
MAEGLSDSTENAEKELHHDEQADDDSECISENITKKKAATKRARPVTLNKSYEHIYTVSDNLFRFDQQRVPAQLIDSDDDDDDNDIVWQGQLSPVKKPRRPAMPKAIYVSSDEEKDDDVCIVGYKTPEKQNTSIYSDKSPSPPPSPPPPSSVSVIVQPRNRRTTKVLRNVDAAVDSIRRNAFQSPLAQSPDDCFIIGSPQEDKTMKVKIRCKLGVQRYDMKMTDCFGVIMKSLAEKLHVDSERILLTLKDDSIVAEDTPLSTNLQITDIIDCVVVDVNAATSDPNDVSESDNDYVQIKVQGKDKSKKIISIKRTDPLERLMEEYSSWKQIPRNKVTFFFDGDKLFPQNTPQDLDMETDDVIDVMIT